MRALEKFKIRYQETRIYATKIITIAFPLIIQGLVFQIQLLTDKAFLGNQDTIYVSAIGAAQMPFNATIDCLIAISVGLVIITSKLFGAGKDDDISRFVKPSIFYNMIAGIILFLLWEFMGGKILGCFNIKQEVYNYSVDYVKVCAIYFLIIGFDCSLQSMLQGIGKTKPIMIAGILKVILNILFSWILIFGKLGFPEMNVKGAAIGSVVADLFSFIYLLSYCNIYRIAVIKKGIKTEWFNIKAYIDVVKLGIPIGMEYFIWNASNLFLIRFINGFSYQDMAIYTLTISFQGIIYVIFNSTSKTTLTLMGQCIGASDRKTADKYFYVSIFINFCIVISATFLFYLFPNQLLSIFSNDKEIITRGASYLFYIGIVMFPHSINVICGNGIRANGNTKWMLFSQIFGSVMVVVLSWILIEIYKLNMSSIYITLFFDE